MSENKHIVITEFGEPSVLDIHTSSIPVPANGQVVVKVAFSGVNPIDVKTRSGLGWAAEQNKDNLPWTPGYDIAGSIVVCGDNAEKFVVGQNVAGFIGFPLKGGGYSQYVVVGENELSIVPDAVILEAAAVLPLAGQTAVQALDKAQVKPGERVLILAGAGGVGHLAVQIAVAAQAEVFTTCSEKNLDYMATLGAHAINYQFSAVSERLSDVDVLIDLVGGDAALDALKCLADDARVVSVPTNTAHMVCEKATALGFKASGMLVEPAPDQLDAMLYMVSVGLLKTEIADVIPMAKVAEAHEKVASGHTRGKIILEMK